jgi:hypothetical protein
VVKATSLADLGDQVAKARDRWIFVPTQTLAGDQAVVAKLTQLQDAFDAVQIRIKEQAQRQRDEEAIQQLKNGKKRPFNNKNAKKKSLNKPNANARKMPFNKPNANARKMPFNKQNAMKKSLNKPNANARKMPFNKPNANARKMPFNKQNAMKKSLNKLAPVKRTNTGLPSTRP